MKTHGKPPHPNYLHHKEPGFLGNMREIVFGMQDGMVSTVGAVTGIAVGSGDIFVILLSGVAIIAVESISMGIGSYTSSRSEKKLMQRMLDEECEEIINHPVHEHGELLDLLIEDGWSEEMAKQMAKEASGNRKLMLREMAYRELDMSPDEVEHPARNGIFMFFAYIVGGVIPLLAYVFAPLPRAIHISVAVTLIGLFVLGAVISRYTSERWYATGGHMFMFGGIALLVGFLIGSVAQTLSM